MPEVHLKQGQVIDGRYVVETLIGEGGMAAVYRVRHVHLDTLHALKVLTMSATSVQRRLMQEGRVQAALRHPNIVAVTDVVPVEGAPGLVLEYVRGPSLETWMQSRKFTDAQIDDLAIGMLDGVQAAHSLDLIHRDLKPANVMLGITPDTLVPKVADFGLVKLLAGEAGGGPMSKTRTGSTMGTPAYMAPEQCHDAKNVDHRADLWSLGVILWEILASRPCFDSDSLVTMLVKVTAGDFVPIRSLDLDVPERMIRAVEASMVVDVDKRVQSIEELRSIWLEGAIRSARSPWTRKDLEEAENLGAGGVATADMLEQSFRSEVSFPTRPTAVPEREHEVNSPTVVPTNSQENLEKAALETYIAEGVPSAAKARRQAAPPKQGAQEREATAATLVDDDLAATALPPRPPTQASSPRWPWLLLALVGLVSVSAAGIGIGVAVGLSDAGTDTPDDPRMPIQAEPEPQPEPEPEPQPEPEPEPQPEPANVEPQARPTPLPTPVAPVPQPDAVPEPVAPEPVAPEPEPVAEPTVAPLLHNPYVAIDADVTVVLVDEGGLDHPGNQTVPEGSYTLVAFWQDRVRTDVQKIFLARGTRYSVYCRKSRSTCKVEPK